MKINKKAFSFVELIVVISVLIILSLIWYTVLNSSKKNTYNTKIKADIQTIQNSLFEMLEETKVLPQPGWNNNYFTIESAYSHSWSVDSFWVYGSITEDTIAKKYLDIVPIDPISNHYYSYWKTLDNKYFEIASVVRTDEKIETFIEWNYPWEYWPISLIREYDGPFFITDKNTSHFPYNPSEHIISATLWEINWTEIYINNVQVTVAEKTILRKWDVIETRNASSNVNIYFSDWSISNLWWDSELIFSDLIYKNAENNLFTKVKVYLKNWSVFTKATWLSSNSDFEIYTNDTTAAVRWTIFLVEKIGWSTSISVLEWKVDMHAAPEIDNIDRPTILEKNQHIIKTIERVKKEVINEEWDNNRESFIPEYITDNIWVLESNKPEWKEDFTPEELVEEDIVKSNCWIFLNWTIQNFYNIWTVPAWYNCPTPIAFTCNEWIWYDSSKAEKNPNFKYTSCWEEELNACKANSSYTYWAWWTPHIYKIPYLENDQSATESTTINNVTWDFTYNLNLKCEDWNYEALTENLASRVCKPWYVMYWSICKISECFPYPLISWIASCSCPSDKSLFELRWNSYCENKITIWGSNYELKSFAPYDFNDGLKSLYKIYFSDWTHISSSKIHIDSVDHVNKVGYFGSWFKSSWINFYTQTSSGTSWIIFDRTYVWDKLKYYNPPKLNFLNWDYAIEMRVFLPRKDSNEHDTSWNLYYPEWNFYLLDSLNWKMELYLTREAWDLWKIKRWSAYKDITTYMDDKFHTITITNDWDLKIDNDKLWNIKWWLNFDDEWSLIIWGNNFYNPFIGADDYKDHINSIVDYVKIYNK